MFIITMSLKLNLCSAIFLIALAQCACGLQLRNSTSGTYKLNRVIGGTEAKRGEFAHQVSLQLGYPPYIPLKHICGGTIINQQWILTAAHCVSKLPHSGQFVVKAGKHLIKSVETNEQDASVVKVFIHPEYRGEVSPYDIALLRLSTSLKLNNFVKTIDLPAADVIPRGKAILSGWGSISKTIVPILPDILQKVTLPLIDIDLCRQAVKLLGEEGEIHDTNLCAGPLTTGFSACSGDSGGPLISSNERGIREVIGVVSWGQVPCGGYGSPTVFVRVSAFVEWINHVISDYDD